jgi:molybdopterin-binding protein
MSPIGPGSVAPPPFMGSGQQGGGDPFAAGAAPMRSPQDVRIVIDDKPVDDAEVGRKSKASSIILLVCGVALGLAAGYFVTSTASSRQQFGLAVKDGKDIYAAVQSASDAVGKAQTSVNNAITAAQGQKVDYASIEALRALKKPFEASQFSSKRYMAFSPAAVDDLFAYYNNVNLLWAKFERLAARTLSEQRRKALDASAESTAAVATPTGCVPSVAEGGGGILCGLVFLEPKEGSQDVAVVRSKMRASSTIEKKVFKGDGAALIAKPDDFVILIDSQKSVGVLSQGASEFASYAADLSELKALLAQTTEIQGRLEKSLGEIASMQ